MHGPLQDAESRDSQAAKPQQQTFGKEAVQRVAKE